MVSSADVKRLLLLHGKVQAQPASDWKGTFPLPTSIEKFYQEVGPLDVTIEVHGNPYFLPRLAGLWDLQAGYRWNGLSGERLNDWKDDWVVVADEGGDPFVFVQSSEEVWHDFHGAGKWNPTPMFPDLNTMAACLGQLGAIALEAGEAFTDADCNIRTEWRKEALVRLNDLVGSSSSASGVLGVLWG